MNRIEIRIKSIRRGLLGIQVSVVLVGMGPLVFDRPDKHEWRQAVDRMIDLR